MSAYKQLGPQKSKDVQMKIVWRSDTNTAFDVVITDSGAAVI